MYAICIKEYIGQSSYTDKKEAKDYNIFYSTNVPCITAIHQARAL